MEGVGSILPAILSEGDGKWQVNLLRAELLSTLATKAPKQMGRNLTEVVPVLSGLMWDTKPQVKEAATSAIAVVFACDTNTDIKEFVPQVIECILQPEKVPETVHNLAGCVFVQEVFGPECRNVCGKAHEQLTRTSTKPPVWKRIELAKVLATLEGLTRLPGKIKGLSDTVASHTAALALSMLDLKNLKADDWVATLKPILAHPGFDDADKVIASLLETCAKEVQIEEEKEEVDDAEQLCDCQFSLAYGNKVLLNQTKLKLKRGYRYGLCGRNDSGKTSLMRAIANQQVEGFPPATELRTMYVETDVQGELAEVPVLDFVVNHEGLKGLGVTPEIAREKLLSVGFAVDDSTMAPASLTKEVGRLSGGWRMKLALVRAMLLKADILLLDEPTNHLDPGNVKWVIDYLTSLTHVTSIIVSHDIKVLDQVCTHVLQIDQLKLNMFKGNLTH